VTPCRDSPTADGRTHRLSEYRGQRLILVFSEKWNPIMERFGNYNGEETVELDAKTLAIAFEEGPFVWINLSSDTGPRPPIKIATNGQGQFIQGYVPPKADTWRTYDIHGPRNCIEAHIAQDGKLLRK
jgi:hypothetical protein